MTSRAKSQFKTLVFLCLPLVFSGCTSLQFSDYDQVIRVTTRHEGAEIWVDGKAGRSPRH